jgi:hypothetical protein
MATVTKGKTFTSGETVTPTKLNELVDNATVTYTSSGDTDNASLEVSGNKFQVKDAGVTTAKINDAAVTFAKQQSPQYTGFRNAIINGNFDIWQRGTSFTGNEFGADRWFNRRVGSTCTMSRQAFTLGQTDVPNEPTYFCRMAVTSSAGAGNFVRLQQNVESVRTFAGQNVAISFYAKADSARPIAVELVQYFGTGGSPSSTVEAIGVTKTTLSTSWQKITVTASMPSISGKTLGSNDDHSFSLYVWLDAGSNFNSSTDTLGQQSGTFDIAQVQFEAGSVATPFERRPIGTELALCQRYYQTISSGSGAGYATGAGQGWPVYFRLPVKMRSAPTVTVTYNAANCTVTTENIAADHFASIATSSGSGTLSWNCGEFKVNAEL